MAFGPEHTWLRTALGLRYEDREAPPKEQDDYRQQLFDFESSECRVVS